MTFRRLMQLGGEWLISVVMMQVEGSAWKYFESAASKFIFELDVECERRN